MNCHRGWGKVIAFSFAAAVSVQIAAGQGQQQPSTPPGGGGTTPSPGAPGRTTPTTPTPTQPRFPEPERQRMPEMQRPIFLSGKVMLDDGTAPAEPVLIERVCNGNPRPEGYTDSKGRFSFQLGQNSMLIPDASVSSASDDPFSSMGAGGGFNRGSAARGGSGMGADMRLMGCELRASLPGYRSDVVNLAGRRVMDNPEVGTIILHRLGNVEGTTISITSMQAPKDAKKAFEKGSEANKKQKWADAQKNLEKAVALYPKYASAWYELGVAYQAQNNNDKAREAYGKALEADPRFIKPYLQLAFISQSERKWKEVLETTDRVVRLDPVDFPQVFMLNSIANLNLGNLDAAEKSAREADKLDTAHRMPKIQHVLGVVLANKGDFQGATERIRSYLQLAPNASDAEAVRKMLGDIEQRAAQAGTQTPQPRP